MNIELDGCDAWMTAIIETEDLILYRHEDESSDTCTYHNARINSQQIAALSWLTTVAFKKEVALSLVVLWRKAWTAYLKPRRWFGGRCRLAPLVTSPVSGGPLEVSQVTRLWRWEREGDPNAAGTTASVIAFHLIFKWGHFLCIYYLLCFYEWGSECVNAWMVHWNFVWIDSCGNF